MCASVDKFGHHLTNRKQQPGPPGIGFKIDENGNFDIKNKKLTNVLNPTEDTDAVTLKFLRDNNFINILPDKKYIDIKNKRLVNVETPIDEFDVVNKKYLKSAKEKIENDIQNKCLLFNDDSFIDIKNKHFINIPEPSKETDIVTKKYVDNMKLTIETRCLQQKENEPYVDMNQRHFINLPDPIKEGDVITKLYFDQFIQRINYNITVLKSEIRQLDENNIALKTAVDKLNLILK